MKKFTINNKIWQWNGGQGPWHFINVSDADSKKIKDSRPKVGRRGFGSVRVKCTLNKTTWSTSIFPTKDGPYVLPIKASVRGVEMAQDGDRVRITCVLV